MTLSELVKKMNDRGVSGKEPLSYHQLQILKSIIREVELPLWKKEITKDTR